MQSPPSAVLARAGDDLRAAQNPAAAKSRRPGAPARLEVLEQRPMAPPQRRGVASRHARCLLQPLAHLRLRQDETPGRRSAGTGYRRCVSKPSSGSSKSFVRKTASSLLLLQHLLGPVRRLAIFAADGRTPAPSCPASAARPASRKTPGTSRPANCTGSCSRSAQVSRSAAAPSPSVEAPAPRSAPAASRPNGPAPCSSDSPEYRPASVDAGRSGLMCVCGSTSTSESSSSKMRWRRSSDIENCLRVKKSDADRPVLADQPQRGECRP